MICLARICNILNLGSQRLGLILRFAKFKVKDFDFTAHVVVVTLAPCDLSGWCLVILLLQKN